MTAWCGEPSRSRYSTGPWLSDGGRGRPSHLWPFIRSRRSNLVKRQLPRCFMFSTGTALMMDPCKYSALLSRCIYSHEQKNVDSPQVGSQSHNQTALAPLDPTDRVTHYGNVRIARRSLCQLASKRNMHYSHLLRRARRWAITPLAPSRACTSKLNPSVTATARSYHAASVLPSLVSSSSPEFRARAEAMDQVVADLEAKLAAARAGGGAKATERMRSKGKKLPRERCRVSPPLSNIVSPC